EILDIEIAGLLHDIGTIGIPAYLLKKADYEITPTEKAVIRQHPIIGQETVAKIMRLDKVSKIIRH
ncbi:MAG: HD domain-containing protein, partial [candidate division Zixibacteria bacterium]|nr:HD domain-containing protein [candidate division Zixibacteria bacterium]